jgi:hypothetical protein
VQLLPAQVATSAGDEVVCSALLVPATREVTNGKQFQFAHLLTLNPHLLLRFRLTVWQWKITKFLFVMYYIEEVVCFALLVSKEWEVTNDE